MLPHATKFGFWVSLSGSCLVASLALGQERDTHANGTGDIDFFEARIRPILIESCFECHGGEKHKSGLRLDSLEGMLIGGERGPALVSGAPDDSLLLVALGWGDPDLQMPPTTRLSEQTVRAFSDWIAEGAAVSADFLEARPDKSARIAPFNLEERLGHWSFLPIRKLTPPKSSHPERVNNPIDAFVEASLVQAGITPNPPADRYTLLRRVSFDLTGLPPTPDEISDFVNDGSADAFERVLDRLLSAPAYGEHWARHWLDLMRYAESRGHEFDYDIPNAWQYRDYVVRALQDDVPYDRFVLEHIAGDLVSEPRPNRDAGWDESILGTGSWFLGEEVHSPVDIRADQVERLANQIDVVTKSFLGLTVACARCHDHKFDAIPTEDYYAMAGFALSSSQRQVRFETRAANARVARDLALAEARFAPEIARVYGEAWADASGEVARLLLVARQFAGADPEQYPALPVVADANEDIPMEDFEGEDWGDWVVEGDAFGSAPARVADAPDFMGELNAVGAGLAHSFIPGGTDERTGSLTGLPFMITRRYLRFRINGGYHLDNTGVQLWLLEPDGSWKLTITRTGMDANFMEEKFFDMRAWIGRTARIRIFDQELGGWGNIGVDDLVLSEHREDAATRAKQHLDQRRLLYLVQLSEREGFDLDRLKVAVDLVEAAREQPQNPLQALFQDEQPGSAAVATGASSPVALVLADWGALSTDAPLPAWFVDGPSFGVAPRKTGDVLLGAAPWRPLARVVSLGGPQTDPAWDGLALTPDTEVLRTKLDWVQSGRTLKTETFGVPEQPLWYLVDGGADVFVEVDGHRLVQGPLHGDLILHIEDLGLRWVRQDISFYAGQRAHIEFTSRAQREPGGIPFALHAIVASAEEPALPLERNRPARLFWSLVGEADGVTRLATELRSAALALAHGRLTREDARLADWMARNPQLLSEQVTGQGRFDTSMGQAFRDWFEARQGVAQAARMLSHTAPAMFAGTGVDEHVLIRGGYRTPGDLVPRRAPVGVAGQVQEPMGETGDRLVLAQRMLAPENPFLARVQVNRVWHHLFGRGLVPTVDNLGVLGELPSHPDLLDWLATWTREQGWSTKQLVRLIVSSQAYQRSSRLRPDLRALDAENLLLHRTSLRRLSGEQLRDAMLAISGELNSLAFGPPVPVHLSEFLNGRGRPENSGPVDGGGRRSLWLAVRRNFPQAFFSVFDRPKPTTTVGRRSRSNVPAQALTLMNDPFVQQQARAWSQRLRAQEPDRSQRIERMFLEAFGRPILDDERESVLNYLADEAARWRLGEDGARLWDGLAHVLLSSKDLCFLR